MKIFIICCLLFIYVNICIFICGFPVSILVSGIRGFGFGDRFPPESISGSGFDFGFRFWVHGDSIRSEPDPLPSLTTSRVIENNPCQKYTRPQGNITMAPVCFQKKGAGIACIKGNQSVVHHLLSINMRVIVFYNGK